MKPTHDELVAHLKATKGYMLNSLIDIETGVKRETTAGTLRNGIQRVDEVLKLIDAQEIEGIGNIDENLVEEISRVRYLQFSLGNDATKEEAEAFWLSASDIPNGHNEAYRHDTRTFLEAAASCGLVLVREAALTTKSEKLAGLVEASTALSEWRLSRISTKLSDAEWVHELTLWDNLRAAIAAAKGGV